MTFEELYEYARVFSGNFIIPEEAIEVGLNQFHILLKNSIGWYQRYTPLVFTYNINTNGQINYIFTGYEYPKANEWKIPLSPKKVLDVFPVYSTFCNPYVFKSLSSGANALSSFNNSPKTPFIWRYDANSHRLSLDRGGELEIKASYWHPIMERIEEIETETGEKITRRAVDLPSISPTDIDFLNMVTGHYMVSLAHSRSIFSIQASPVTFDFQTMLSQGTQILKDAQQSIIDNSDFYLAWG